MLFSLEETTCVNVSVVHDYFTLPMRLVKSVGFSLVVNACVELRLLLRLFRYVVILRFC